MSSRGDGEERGNAGRSCRLDIRCNLTSAAVGKWLGSTSKPISPPWNIPRSSWPQELAHGLQVTGNSLPQQTWLPLLRWPSATVRVICISFGKCMVVASRRKGVVGGGHKALSYGGLHRCWTPDHVESIPATNLSYLWMPGVRLDSGISLSVFFQCCTSVGRSSVGKWWLCPTPFLSPVASQVPRAILHHEEVLELQSVVRVPFYPDGCHTVRG